MNKAVVYIVDDDDAVRDALSVLVRSIGLAVEMFSSADEFAQQYARKASTECIVLDMRMPGMSGLDFMRWLASQSQSPPVIMLTGHGDVPMAVEAMKLGAVDFLLKPFRDQDLIDRIHDAIARDGAGDEVRSRHLEIQERISHLTPREREVMRRVAKGETNKSIAFDLNLSERTVEIHRSRVMEKMGAGSLAELVGMVLEHDAPQG
jgi:FixJ family two-component response regulator